MWHRGLDSDPDDPGGADDSDGLARAVERWGLPQLLLLERGHSVLLGGPSADETVRQVRACARARVPVCACVCVRVCVWGGGGGRVGGYVWAGRWVGGCA
jgi:hypothetical protein